MKRLPVEDLEHIFQNTHDVWESFRGKSIFLTGGTGFFGKWFLETFLYGNHILKLNTKIYVLSREPEYFLEQFPFFKNQNLIEFIKGDVISFVSSNTDIDFIIHAATEASASLLKSMPVEMMDTIILGTRQVLNFARNQKNLKGILLTSSGAVYGKYSNLDMFGFKESDNASIDFTSPNSSYSEGKRIAELYFASYCQEYNIPAKIARCFAFVGPHLPLNKHFAIGNFIGNINKSENIIIKGDGKTIRSYMYASDLIIWLILILVKGKVGSHYNVGSNSPKSISEIAHLVSEYNSNSNVVISNSDANGAVDIYFPNTDKFLLDFPNLKKIELSDAIEKTIKFYMRDERS